MTQQTSTIIRKGINKAWKRHNRLLRQSWTALARGQREAIARMEIDYVKALEREKGESR